MRWVPQKFLDAGGKFLRSKQDLWGCWSCELNIRILLTTSIGRNAAIFFLKQTACVEKTWNRYKQSVLCSNTWQSLSCFDVTGWVTCSMAWMRTLQWDTRSSVASSRWLQRVMPSPSSPLTSIRYICSPWLTGITLWLETLPLHGHILHISLPWAAATANKKKSQSPQAAFSSSAVDLWYLLFVLLIRCASGLSTGTWPQRRSTYSWDWCMKHWLTAKKGKGSDV